MSIKLTEYSHGAGCGCKISPNLLEQILASDAAPPEFANLIVGNSTKDDAAAFAIDEKQIVLSTTDFFMPIVDDAFDFGRIAATNAISDIYAMGGKPIMAIAILGWPIAKLPPSVASQVIEGGRHTCLQAGIPLAGGHSIDAPEPIFGLAVTGLCDRQHLKKNNEASAGDKLYLTKPLGIGILTTAQKQKKLNEKHRQIAPDIMTQLNDIGAKVAQLEGVNAMTDVTGFGLCGHLLEVCEASGVSAVIYPDRVPVIEVAQSYLQEGCIPGGTQRNFESYGDKLANISEQHRHLFCDPQTSGGLLIAVSPDNAKTVEDLLRKQQLHHECIGYLEDVSTEKRIRVEDGN